MSEFGLKIALLQAASIYSVNNGTRLELDEKPAMLTNSLFLDFLREHGLQTNKSGESTRDVICIEFGYGTRSYDEEMAYLKRKRKELEKDDKLSDLKRQQYTEFYNGIEERANANKDKFDKKTKEELRVIFYTQGVDVGWNHYDAKLKAYTLDEVIHYKMLYRSTGKAKKGSCIFIRDSLYEQAHDFLWMGLQLPKENAPIVEIGAYSSLIASTIVGKIHINPRNILILKDVDSFFKTNVISVETNEKNQCIAKHIDNYEGHYDMFDGEALIEHSLLPDWVDGYVLLRQHFFKAAAFDTNLQQYFKDYYGDVYETATVTDMFGVVHQVKDIEMMTTNNSIKWSKFDVTYDYWCSKVDSNGDMFGIVKTSHASKFGDVQRMSYQMVNCLDIDKMDEIMQTSKDYIYSMKVNDDVYFDYLERNANFSNDYDVLAALAKYNPEFTRSDYYRERKKKIINNYLTSVKTGKLIQHGDNLTLVGSPLAFLMYATGQDPADDPTLKPEDDCIQCYSEMFDDGEYLAEFRSPFNSRDNLGLLHNIRYDLIKQYFNLGKHCIAVNTNHTDFESRNNGLKYWPSQVVTFGQTCGENGGC